MSKRNRHRKHPADSTSPGDQVHSDDLVISLPIETSSLRAAFHDELDAATLATVDAGSFAVLADARLGTDRFETDPSAATCADTDVSVATSPAATALDEPKLALIPAAATEVNSLGARLLAARTQTGFSREDVARRLHVSTALVDAMERDDWSRLGAPVYVRGHLSSLAREVGLPQVVVQRALEQLVVETPLTPAVVASSRGSGFGRHASALTYIMLTLLLAIPTITMLRSRGVNSPVPQVRSLVETDADFNPAAHDNAPVNPPVSTVVEVPSIAAATADFAQAEHTGPIVETNSVPPTPAPLMASMAPVLGSQQQAEALPNGQHRITLTVTADSWIEVVDAQGTRLEYGIVRAGESREHVVRGPVSVNFGNVSGVRLQLDGDTVDLQPYARLNVARLRLLETQPTAPPAAR